jgi:hypothetical protein
MPNINRDQTVYIPTGNPDTWFTETLQRPGELGKAYDWNDRSYQRVKLDSGATASNTVGVVAANQLAFWKDRANYIVTNDKRFGLRGGIANSFGNNVAGVFRAAVTAGYYCDILIRGRNIPVAAVAGTDAGELVIVDTTASTASADSVAVGTAVTYQCLGVVRTSVAANVAYVDFDIPNVP